MAGGRLAAGLRLGLVVGRLGQLAALEIEAKRLAVALEEKGRAVLAPLDPADAARLPQLPLRLQDGLVAVMARQRLEGSLSMLPRGHPGQHEQRAEKPRDQRRPHQATPCPSDAA